MGTAYNDSVPVLHIVSENDRTLRGKSRGFFHDIRDQFGVFRSVVDFGMQVDMPEQVPHALRLAVHALRSRRPRPAMVEITGDALVNRGDVSLGSGLAVLRRAPSREQVRAAAGLLASAKSPLIWAGGGVSAAGACASLLKVAERLGTPVLTSQGGKGAIPADHPLHLGNWGTEKPVQELIRGSDVLLAVGTRFSYFPTVRWTLELPRRLIQIDIDPAEIGRNYPVEIGMVGDAQLALATLLTEFDALGFKDRPSRHGEVEALRKTVLERIGPREELDVLDQIRSALPRNAIVCNDPTTIVFWARFYWPAYEPRTWLLPAGFGTLGYALPAAVGAKIACPDQPVVALIGDAGVMFTIQDLMTAVQEKVPITVIIFNDEGYGVERRHQDHLYGRRCGVDIKPPDFMKLAEAFGAVGLRVKNPREVGAALRQALDSGRPTILEVPTRFNHPGYGSFGQWK
jgi:thiamine pyrophosphate-dependent acetolactate synthase large subunit-like protein